MSCIRLLYLADLLSSRHFKFKYFIHELAIERRSKSMTSSFYADLVKENGFILNNIVGTMLTSSFSCAVLNNQFKEHLKPNA